MKDNEIYKELKQCYNMLKDKYNIIVVSTNNKFTFNTVPNNWNAKLKITVIILPEANYLLGIDNVAYANIETENSYIIIKDIRDVLKEEYSNCYLNNFFGCYKIINKKYKSFLDRIYSMKSDNLLYSLSDLFYLIKVLLLEDLKSKLCPSIKDLNLSHYKTIFVTGDNHFGHKNILNYERRSQKLNVSNIEEHDNKLIELWNETVSENDLVFILGDFSFRPAKATMEILQKLKGEKILIEGNHDYSYLKNKAFDRLLFKEIISYKEIKYLGKDVILMHYPILDFKNQHHIENPAVMLHAHIHSNRIDIPQYTYNVGVDINGFKPISLERAIAMALYNAKGGTNGFINSLLDL